jgi:PDZ domain-containing protein
MRRPLALVVIAVGVLLGALFVVPSDHYLFLPDPARPVDPLVKVPGERSGGSDEAGIYMVDILVDRASLIERVFPAIRDGASLVPSHVVNPEGLSETERRRQSLNEMSASQKVAVVVALESLGYQVPTEAEVVRVQPGAPAEGKLEPGDVILAARGRRIGSPLELFEAMRAHRPGNPVAVTIRRSGQTRRLVVGTKPADDDKNRAVMGVLVDLEVDPPVDVRINAGDIGGPSAGLAFALDVVDELGRDIDGGRRIAVTGALTLDGAVEAIGGIKQKAIGAQEAGADVFLVPDGNAREARRHAGDLEVIAVSTFAEALARLRGGGG